MQVTSDDILKMKIDAEMAQNMALEMGYRLNKKQAGKLANLLNASADMDATFATFITQIASK